MNAFVSVLVPVYNEEKHIAGCLDSIGAQSYPKDSLEVFVIDGCSTDNTKRIVEGYSEEHPFIRVLDNPEKIVPTALNIGIEASKGDVIIRMDAHAFYDRDYIAKCVETLRTADAYNVGGPIVTLPGDDTPRAKAIALATSHPFGVGNSKFRVSREAEYVDTVTFGAFKRKIFDRVGLFNEKLVRNQDIEFNSRIRKSGGKIFLNPEIRSYYYNRSTFKDLWRQNFKNGIWNVFTETVNSGTLSVRHFVPFVFTSSLIASIVLAPLHRAGIFIFLLIAGSYLLANVLFAFRIGLKHDLKIMLLLPAVFLTLHFSYGFGSIVGFFRLRRWKKEFGG
jgi:glycosyltransferase involved in cell wall biosynthesis